MGKIYANLSFVPLHQDCPSPTSNININRRHYLLKFIIKFIAPGEEVFFTPGKEDTGNVYLVVAEDLN